MNYTKSSNCIKIYTFFNFINYNILYKKYIRKIYFLLKMSYEAEEYEVENLIQNTKNIYNKL